MKSPRSFRAGMFLVWMVVGLTLLGIGTWAHAETPAPGVSVGEDTSSIHSRLGGTMRSQGPSASPEKAFTVQPGTVPAGENPTSIHSRLGGTMRGQGPSVSPEEALTVQTGTVPAAENIASASSVVGRTLRGQEPRGY